MNKKLRPIAIYLPQFHPIPENDEWWGKGFTEWTNVTRAQPRFKGHYQPHLPADLGFYDLRLPEVHEAQASMAADHGIYGFCYYHYWFNGKRLMKRAIDPMIESGKPDFPFMFCWANETWSRNWLGEEKSILIKQEYSHDDDIMHAEYLANIFRDSRYIKINSRPVFCIYRPSDLPDARRTLEVIRTAAKANGLDDPYFVASNSRPIKNPDLFDAILNFEPQLGLLKNAFHDEFIFKRFINNFLKFKVINGRHKLYDYEEVKKIMEDRPISDKTFPCIFVGWDNTARRGPRAIVIHNQNLSAFKKSLESAIAKVISKPNPDERIVFINAWNEWAEGNHLEPCHKYGTSYLEAVKESVIKASDTKHSERLF